MWSNNGTCLMLGSAMFTYQISLHKNTKIQNTSSKETADDKIMMKYGNLSVARIFFIFCVCVCFYNPNARLLHHIRTEKRFHIKYNQRISTKQHLYPFRLARLFAIVDVDSLLFLFFVNRNILLLMLFFCFAFVHDAEFQTHEIHIRFCLP